MDRVDRFESVFRAADKPVFHLKPPPLRRVWLISDLEGEEAATYERQVESYLDAKGRKLDVVHTHGDVTRAVGALLQDLEEVDPDLVCTYRGLHGDAWRYRFGLGPHVDVFSQAAPCPVLVLPHPELMGEEDAEPPSTVMAMTNHLSGDESLVNAALAFAFEGQKLVLCHVEDACTFDRYMEVISKLPSIDTETAREDILARLLREPRDYIESCREALERSKSGVAVDSIVVAGHRLEESRRLVDEHVVRLLVLHARDEDQLAMHGMAHPLAVELSELPILLV